jgi:hypothetical protein
VGSHLSEGTALNRLKRNPCTNDVARGACEKFGGGARRMTRGGERDWFWA